MESIALARIGKQSAFYRESRATPLEAPLPPRGDVTGTFVVWSEHPNTRIIGAEAANIAPEFHENPGANFSKQA